MKIKEKLSWQICFTLLILGAVFGVLSMILLQPVFILFGGLSLLLSSFFYRH